MMKKLLCLMMVSVMVVLAGCNSASDTTTVASKNEITAVQTTMPTDTEIEPSMTKTTDLPVISDSPTEPSWTEPYWVMGKVSPRPISYWDGSVADGFESGLGTREAPYIISNAAQLAYLSDYVNSGQSYAGECFSLESDIDLSNREWVPIGTEGYPFCGSFAGGNHKIRGMSIRTEYTYSGLFGLAADAEITGLYLEDATIHKSGSCTGLIVGELDGKHSPAIIRSCVSNGQISISKGEGKVGGIVGECDGRDVSVVSCVSSCMIGVPFGSKREGVNCTIGGIVGYFDPWSNQCLINQCLSLGRIENGETAGGILGGIYGRSESGVNISNCMTCLSIVKTKSFGGIVGYCGDAATSTSSILNCVFSKNTSRQAVARWYNGPRITNVQVAPNEYFLYPGKYGHSLVPHWMWGEYIYENDSALWLRKLGDMCDFFPEVWMVNPNLQ